MKKLIAILAVMIVLVGAVFAADTSPAGTSNQIDITTCVNELFPAFRLTPVTVTTAQTGTTNTSATSSANGSVTLKTDMLLDGPASIVFNVEQIDKSRTKKSYDITVSATPLVLEGYTESSASTNQKFAVAVSGYKGEGITNELTDVDYVTTSKLTAGNGFRFAYSGSAINAASDSAKVLGEFTVTWTGNVNAEVGNYSAYVKIEIANTN